MFHLVQGGLRTVLALAEECLQLAEQMHDTGALLEAHLAEGHTCLMRGELVRAREAYEQILARYQPQHHALTPLYGGFNLKSSCLCSMAMPLWSLGYPEQALTRSHEALQMSQELGSLYNLAHTLGWT